MNMKHKSIEYFALINTVKAPGVSKKIENVVKSARTIGISARMLAYPASIKGICNVFIKLLVSRADVVFIRFSDLAFPFLVVPLILLRLRGVKIVVDVPTPRVTCMKEMDLNIKNPLIKFFRKSWSFLSGSWVLFPANLIVQYAEEGSWFSMGIKAKMKKIGNGILIDDEIPVVKPSNTINDEITLIGVAQLADWHGYDRLLIALSELKLRGNTRFKLVLVGDGEALASLKTLSNNLLLDNVIFTGRLVGESLNQQFENSNVGIASLGLYRIGLDEASVLKTREYMARGLPVISAGKDPDFTNNCPFRFSVSNSDETQSISDCLESLPERLKDINSFDVRCYAETKLSIDAKLRDILEVI